MIAQHALDHGAQIGGRRRGRGLRTVRVLQARPVGDHATARDRAAGEQRDGAGAVIGAVGAVDARGAAELGDATTIAVSLQRAPSPRSNSANASSRPPSSCASRPDRAAFVGVGVPAVEGERGDARAVVGAPSAARRRAPPAHRRDRHCRPAVGFMSSPVAACLELQALRQRVRERGIAVPIEIEQPRRGVVVGLRQRDRRPADRRRRRRAAPAAWSGRPPARRSTRSPCGSASSARLSQPDCTPARTGIAAFQHVLAVEMRAVAIGRRRRHGRPRPACRVQPREIRHRRMQAEEAVEHERRMRPVRGQRDRAVQRGIIGIADRRHGGKSIERAAQDHDDQPRIAAVRGAREFRQVRPGGERGAAEQERAPRRRK